MLLALDPELDLYIVYVYGSGSSGLTLLTVSNLFESLILTNISSVLSMFFIDNSSTAKKKNNTGDVSKRHSNKFIIFYMS